MKCNTICKSRLVHCSESLFLQQRTEVPCPVLFYTQAISKILKNQSSMTQYGYIYFMWDQLYSISNTSAHCSRYQYLLQCTSVNVQILLYFIFYTYSPMYGLWMMETCGRCDVLIIKLHIGIWHWAFSWL